LAPVVDNASTFPILVPVDTILTLSVNSTDNDSLWLVQFVARSIAGDSIAIPLERLGNNEFAAQWQVPLDTTLWHYYYQAEDMWENVTYYPEGGPYSPLELHVGQIHSLFEPPEQPKDYLLSVYPNPLNSSTTISFFLSHSQLTTISVYDLTGRIVLTLADEIMNAGVHAVVFDGTELSSGIYFAQLKTSNSQFTRKLVLIK
jgi:hypothetical protein